MADSFRDMLVKVLKREPARWHVDDLVARLGKFGSPAELARKIEREAPRIRGCVRGEPKYWVYLPVFRTHAIMVQPLTEARALAKDDSRVLIWLPEVLTLIIGRRGHFPEITLQVDGYGPVVLKEYIDQSSAFGGWLAGQRDVNGINALEIECESGPDQQFRVRPIHRENSFDLIQVDGEARALALQLMARFSRGFHLNQLAELMIARGFYHRPMAPSPLLQILLHPTPSVISTDFEFYPMAKMPAKRLELIASRSPEWAVDDDTYTEFSGGLGREEPEDFVRRNSAMGTYQVEVRIENVADVSRVIAVGGSTSIHQLHAAIMDSLGLAWDADWAMVLGGERGIIIGDDWATSLEAATTRMDELEFKTGEVLMDVLPHYPPVRLRLRIRKFSPGLEPDAPMVIDSQGAAPALSDMG